MGFKVIEKVLNGLILLQPDVYHDERGFFLESYKKNIFSELGIDTEFVQENHSCSSEGIVRGLHFQWNPPQGKLIRVISGAAKFVEVDIRRYSPTFGEYWIGEISAENMLILWVPSGFANGFCSLTDSCEVLYKCTANWNKEGEGSLLWNDPDIGIKWDIDNPILSEKDKSAPTLKEWMNSDVPYFKK